MVSAVLSGGKGRQQWGADLLGGLGQFAFFFLMPRITFREGGSRPVSRGVRAATPGQVSPEDLGAGQLEASTQWDAFVSGALPGWPG